MTVFDRLKSWSPQLAVWKALLLCLPVTLFSTLVFSSGLTSGDTLYAISCGFAWLVFNGAFFLMLLTGKTHRYRATLFTLIAVTFSIGFIADLFETRGSMALTEETALSGETPFCHLVIPMTIIPAIFTRTIIFPGSMLGGYAVAGMFVLWIGATLAMGRGWCSWGCFYGGLDEGFARILKKPVIKRIDRRWIYLPFAVLLVVVLTSALTLTPTYCDWLCPFKAVTEFEAITSWVVVVKTVIFVSLFLVTVVVLPLLTKRRIQCGLFCPFGAMQSFLNKINVFEVRIDPEKCVQCGLCVKTCPTFSLDEGSLESGKPLITCTKCGQCVDICPKQAISYHIKGTPLQASATVARVLFLYPAYLLMSTIGGSMVSVGVWRILLLVTTGSMV